VRLSFGVAGTPFDPQRQSTVAFRRTAEKRTIGGRVCQAFEYSRSDPAGSRFSYKGPGEWYPTRVEVEGSGGLLFIRKSIRGTIELLDFHRDEGTSSAQ
jgi:hypothetical protein